MTSRSCAASGSPRGEGSGARLRAALLGALFLAAAGSAAAHDWNQAAIGWRKFDEGLAAAKTEGKPVCLVFYTEWCPHCSRYAKVFRDPKVVELSRKFVMVLVDRDANKELSGRFALDGEYIPRTYFLSADGKPDPEIHAPRENYKYFFDESNPAGILAGMEAALKKLGGAPGLAASEESSKTPAPEEKPKSAPPEARPDPQPK